MGSTEPIKVVLVEDHPAMVAGVRAWCAEAEPAIEVVDAQPDPAVAWQEPGRSAQVVVLDLLLRSKTTPAYADLRELVDDGRNVIVYSMREDDEATLTCIDIGASSYLTKTEGQDHLVDAIHAVAHDLPYVSPAMAGALSGDTRAGRPRLSIREIDVLKCWFTCESKALVAAKLGIAENTVKNYLDRIRIKYANVGRPAPTKAALVARAIQDGIVRLEDL